MSERQYHPQSGEWINLFLVMHDGLLVAAFTNKVQAEAFVRAEKGAGIDMPACGTGYWSIQNIQTAPHSNNC